MQAVPMFMNNQRLLTWHLLAFRQIRPRWHRSTCMILCDSVNKSHPCRSSLSSFQTRLHALEPAQYSSSRLKGAVWNTHNFHINCFHVGIGPRLKFTSHQPPPVNALEATNPNAQLYNHLLDAFPDGIQMAFAYGSAVYQQVGHKDMGRNMLDFILVVDDPEAWHSVNLRKNRSHYSFLKYMGSHAIAYIQEWGGGVYFNTMVPFENRIIKYGVIRTDRLITDLLDWDTLYISGRLHKPIKLLIHPTNTDLVQAMQVNLQSAVHTALLLLPEDFTEEALFITIAGLSYNGDFRMVVGEDRNKVTNIVRPNMAHFRKLYGKILESEVHVHWDKENGHISQDPNYVTQFHNLQLLPKTTLMLMQENRTRPGSHPDIEEVLKVYAHSSHCDDVVAHCINSIVWRSSMGQSAKTILTAGAKRSAIYTIQKVIKMWRGGFKKMVEHKAKNIISKN